MKRVLTMTRLFVTILLLSFAGGAAAQQSKKLIAEGNELYQQKKYKEATLKYAQALRSDTAGANTGTFNMGNSLYQQQQLDAARQAYEASGKKATSTGEKSRADYNTGNTYMKERKWQEAIDAYKNALRKNPQDADAKYNLSYAQTMMKHDNNGGGGKDKNKDKNKDQDKKDQDKNKDQQNKDQDQKDQDQKDQQDKNQGQPKDQDDKDKKDQQDQHPQPQPSKLSQQQADQLLNALQQEEKKLQDKKKKVQGTPVRLEKDW